MKYIRRGLRGFAVEFTGLCDLSLAFEIPGQIGKQDGIAIPGYFKHASIVKFADVRALSLRQDHGHQIVGTRVRRREPNGIARLVFGAGQVALVEQQRGQFLRGLDIVRLERDETLQQGQGGLLLAGSPPDLVENRSAPGRRGAMSNASRVGPSAAVNSPFARAFTAFLTSRSVVSFAVGGGTWLGSISQQRHARRPLPQAHGVFECRFTRSYRHSTSAVVCTVITS